MNEKICITSKLHEFCFGCLKRQENMKNIRENIEIKSWFTELYRIEFEKYIEYPNFLCITCEEQLTSSCKFYKQVLKALECMEYYNSNHKEEETQSTRSEFHNECSKVSDFSDSDNEPLILKQKQNGKRLKKVPIHKIEQAIEEFKNEYNENTACVLCDFIAATPRTLGSHMAYKHSEEKSNWCLKCNNFFGNMEEHQKTHSKNMKCGFCNRTVTRSHYIEHLKSHTGLEFECNICNKKFISKKCLTAHISEHINEKPLKCPNCTKTYTQLITLNNHLKTHGRYTCKNCNKHFEIPELLTSHVCLKLKENGKDFISDDHDSGYLKEEYLGGEEIKIEYGHVKSEELQDEENGNLENTNKSSKDYLDKVRETKKYKETKKIEKLTCTFCQKTYKTSYKLKIHIRGHTGDLPYQCQFCTKKSAVKREMENHERSHTKEKPFVCTVCGKALSAASALRTHMKQHTGRPEQCEICQKRFCRKSELRLHMQKHRGERPFLCTNCGRSFAQKSHLTEHLAVHTEHRPFQCQHCEKAFKKSTLLKQHLLLHEGNKTFKCLNCSYACYKKYRLEQHMKMHMTSYEYSKTEQKPNVCPVCERSFSNLSILNSHMSSIHNAVV